MDLGPIGHTRGPFKLAAPVGPVCHWPIGYRPAKFFIVKHCSKIIRGAAPTSASVFMVLTGALVPVPTSCTELDFFSHGLLRLVKFYSDEPG